MNFFITNREIINAGTASEQIREDGKENAGIDLRFGLYHISKPKDQQFELFPDPTKPEELLYTSLDAVKTADLNGSARFFKAIYDETIKTPKKSSTGVLQGDIIFFIHGFNTNMDGVRSLFKELNDKYINNPDSSVSHAIVFTWPGKTLNLPLHYRNDARDAEASGLTLARCLHSKVIPFMRQFLAIEGNEPCDRKFHLMTHSMGNRVLEHFVRESIYLDSIHELFDQIILLAADVEYNLFDPNKTFSDLIGFGQRIHIYFHEKDGVLDISKYTKNFNNRLGRYGRKSNNMEAPDIIDANVSKTKDDTNAKFREREFNHWYYYSSSEVINDIIEVMKGKKKSKYASK